MEHDKNYYKTYNTGAYEALTEILNVSGKLSKDELVSLMSDMRDNFKKMIDDEVDLNGLWNILIDSVTVPEH